MILTQGSCIGRLILSGHDEMGWWSYHTYCCKTFHRLTIASVYQPCNQQVLDRGHVRALTVTAQHSSLLRQQGRHETPRQAFITDLCQFITDQHAQGNGILLGGDYNEELDIKYDGIIKLCSDFHLVDLMFHLTGCDDFATYAQGSKRIDYIVCDAWSSRKVHVSVNFLERLRRNGLVELPHIQLQKLLQTNDRFCLPAMQSTCPRSWTC